MFFLFSRSCHARCTEDPGADGQTRGFDYGECEQPRRGKMRTVIFFQQWNEILIRKHSDKYNQFPLYIQCNKTKTQKIFKRDLCTTQL